MSHLLQRVWRTRGPLACALWPLSRLFALLAALRRSLFRAGLLRRWTAPVPVIVVGNLIVGGAGKTPVTLSIVELLRRRGYAPGIVSRGYGSDGSHAADVVEVRRTMPASACGDEPLLLHLRSAAPVVVGRDRPAAVRRLLLQHPEVDIVVSDDGLQHLQLARSAQILVFDERGAGNGWLLPAGPLREPVPATVPARSLVVYNARQPTTPLPGTIAQRSIAGVVALADWWRGVPASTDLLAGLRGRTLVAAAGIARPDRFFAMLREHGLTIAPLPLPDHHDYAALPWLTDTADVVVTEKDAIKLDPQRIGATRVWVAPLDFALEPDFDAALLALLPSPVGTHPHGNAPA